MAPEEYPANLLPEQEGDFVVRFFGAPQHAIVSHSNVVAWSKNDDKSRFATGSKKPAFSRAVKEAAEAAVERQEERVCIAAGLRFGDVSPVLDAHQGAPGRTRGGPYFPNPFSER